MSDEQPSAILWYNPGRGACVTRVPNQLPPPSNPSPWPVGAVVRHANMLGEVLPDRVVGEVPIVATSVLVCCTHSLGRFPDLDQKEPNVWSTKTSQRLTGALLKAAQADPEAFLAKFVALEMKVRQQEAAECKPKKRPPGKQHRRSK